ncbi:uncharacterized protein ACLA_080160 [Aspergillus clavatus NRRL 1]|uniref:Uncharacterized protein n=1 Tax=Aspergillus clavatus (strain ATCC 1007 / CBS 513.65 / DSM 816 / NCTC 3887 / NRRL 1 / QM 1276 / 107) TaxID=344612 RepID=A1CSP5_ASPCL|nr:uncharacterized protein ACLA_080160 [Aspergillus clavatus NRRL 1]EAW06332.1 conserved hypothetical protein [Aspergillus clavatus NRRL 1]
MPASFICQALLPSGNHNHHHTSISHIHHDHPLHLDDPTILAASVTTTTATTTSTSPTSLCFSSGYDPSSYLAVSTVPPLDISARAISPCLSDISEAKTFYSTVNVTEVSVDTYDSPLASNPPATESLDHMNGSSERVNVVAAAPSTPPSAGHHTAKRKRTISPPSPSHRSPGHVRSTSRSTRGSAPASRRSSLHSHRRAATVSLTPSVVDRKDPETKRENLLALHRESCRLFQSNGLQQPSLQDKRPLPVLSNTTPYPPQASSEFSSPPASPIVYTRLSFPGREHEPGPGDIPQDTHVSPSKANPDAPKQVTATVIDWTSPSTRRREYEKIDRASTGMRGFWRRVAPRWCQFGDRYMPFFEEGKDGKGNYEGSVRRFRLNLPEEPEKESGKTRFHRGLKLKKSSVIHILGVRRQTV